MDATLKTKAIEIIKNEISKINPAQMHSSKLWTERSVIAGTMASIFVSKAGKGLDKDEAEALKNEIKAAALEAAK